MPRTRPCLVARLQHRLGELRLARDLALKRAFEAGAGISVVGHQVDVFLFEPGSDRYLGRLCKFNQCPKGKRDCLVPGYGDPRGRNWRHHVRDSGRHPDAMPGRDHTDSHDGKAVVGLRDPANLKHRLASRHRVDGR
jgi:hypothetical protein